MANGTARLREIQVAAPKHLGRAFEGHSGFYGGQIRLSRKQASYVKVLRCRMRLPWNELSAEYYKRYQWELGTQSRVEDLCRSAAIKLGENPDGEQWNRTPILVIRSRVEQVKAEMLAREARKFHTNLRLFLTQFQALYIKALRCLRKLSYQEVASSFAKRYPSTLDFRYHDNPLVGDDLCRMAALKLEELPSKEPWAKAVLHKFHRG